MSTTYSNLNALFKEAFVNQISHSQNRILGMFTEFNHRRFNTFGQYFNIPTAFKNATGFSETSFRSASFKELQVKKVENSLFVPVSYTFCAKAGIDLDSMKKYLSPLINHISQSFGKHLEIQLLHGQSGLGVVESVIDNDVLIKHSEWAPGIWDGYIGSGFDVYSGNDKKSTVYLKDVDLLNARLTFFETKNLEPGDVLWTAGTERKEMVGLHKILSTNGRVPYERDVSGHSFLRPQKNDAGLLGIVGAIETQFKIGNTKKQTLLINPSALRCIEKTIFATYKPEALNFLLKTTEFVPSSIVKEGYAYLLNREDWFIVRDKGLYFEEHNPTGGYFRILENNAGFELKLTSDQTIFCQNPSKSAIITNIELT